MHTSVPRGIRAALGRHVGRGLPPVATVRPGGGTERACSEAPKSSASPFPSNHEDRTMTSCTTSLPSTRLGLIRSTLGAVTGLALAAAITPAAAETPWFPT